MGQIKKTEGHFRMGMLLLLLLSSGALLLGCENEGIEEIMEAADELEATHSQTVEELNLLLQEEGELQSHFEETLETDDDLSSFKDGTSSVFTNLSNRKEGIRRIEELEEVFLIHSDTLRDYTGSQLEEDQLEDLATDIHGFTESLGAFRGKYEENLEEKEAYFQSLAAEDATYDVFTEGIHRLNEKHESMREEFYVLDEELALLSQGIEALQQAIEVTQEEE